MCGSIPTCLSRPCDPTNGTSKPLRQVILRKGKPSFLSCSSLEERTRGRMMGGAQTGSWTSVRGPVTPSCARGLGMRLGRWCGVDACGAFSCASNQGAIFSKPIPVVSVDTFFFFCRAVTLQLLSATAHHAQCAIPQHARDCYLRASAVHRGIAASLFRLSEARVDSGYSLPCPFPHQFRIHGARMRQILPLLRSRFL